MTDRIVPCESIATPQASGAGTLDPVAFHYVQSLSQRMQSHHGEVRRRLEQSLNSAHGLLMDRLAAAQNVPPNRAQAAPKETPLSKLLADMGVGRDLTESSAGQCPPGASDELKVIREFRDTWSQLSVDNQVKQAIALAPENAGPLNSHMLVLRSLSQMRELSPDYLNRFMSYVDTLMCLEQPGKKVRSQNANGRTKSSAAGETSKARKTK